MNSVSPELKVSLGAETGDHVIVIEPPGTVMQPVGIPPGLELLAEMDKLEMVELVYFYEVFCPCAKSDRQIDINNISGQLCYVVGEKKCRCACSCWCCCLSVSFNCCKCCKNVIKDVVRVMDRNHEREVIHAWLEIPCCKVQLLPCMDERKTLYVDGPVGTRIGTIEYTKSCCDTSQFTVFDANGQAILIFNLPPCCKSKMSGWKIKWEMEIFSPNRPDRCIGTIQKKEPESCADIGFSPMNYDVVFPIDLDASAKALLLAAPFFIDELGI